MTDSKKSWNPFHGDGPQGQPSSPKLFDGWGFTELGKDEPLVEGHSDSVSDGERASRARDVQNHS